jgi:cell wall-associated NlpC family hydrolase
MTDKRRLHSNGRVADAALLGRVEADLFVDGEDRQVICPTTPLRSTPDGGRARELVFGEAFRQLETRDGIAFGYALRDGYAGYVAADALAPPEHPATHRVAARLSYGLGEPDFKTQTLHLALSLGALVTVTGQAGRWSEIATPEGQLFVPSTHLQPLDQPEGDPVTVASRLLGTPYVWGGNSSLGIDCSGLIQTACLACAIPCPGDSDMQEGELGTPLPPDTPPRRGDLLFWKGHVAWVTDPDTILHANAYHMATTLDPLTKAITRIRAQGDGPVTAHKRLGDLT